MATEEDKIDSKLQKQLLKRLAKYGDSLLDEEEYKKQQKKAKRKKLREQKFATLNQPTENYTHLNQEARTTTKLSKRQKKKLKKQRQKEAINDLQDELDEDSDEEDGVIEQPKVKLHGQKKHLELLKLELGITEADFELMKELKEQKEGKEKDRRPYNRKIKGKRRPAPEVVVFEDPARRKEKKAKAVVTKLSTPSVTEEPEDSGEEFDLKRAKHEVRRFGIKGMDKQSKEEAEVALAIQLGAKPAKSKYVNYKELMEQKKKEKQEYEEALKSRSKDDHWQVRKVKTDKKRKRDRNDIGFVDGQLGKFRGGVQILSRDDMHSVKKQRKGRRN